MKSAYKLNTEDIEALLTENSKKVIETFLTHYGASSKATVRSSVYRLLYHGLSKDDVSKVNFQDYLKIFPTADKKLSTQDSYKQSFFKFLYVFDHLKKSEGFSTIWIKDRDIRQFEKGKKYEEDNLIEPKKPLPIEELMMIQKVLETESTKLGTLKMQFSWFAIFELGIDVVDLKNITSENFSNGQIRVDDNVYKIPEKFQLMFEVLSQQDRIYNGFGTLNVIIENLGKIANLEHKLKPMMIKSARKSYMVTCGNCRNEFTNLSHNWLSVNNRLVCVDCADLLKKKVNFEVNSVRIENINFEYEEQEDLNTLYSYDDLKRDIQNQFIDYLKLHELQIKIGNLGEAFVYEFECNKLQGTKYMDKVDDSKALEPKNGFDILSYTRTGIPLHIEVKTTIGTEDRFILSSNELQTAKRMKKEGLNYVVYFVKEIMSDNPKLTVITNISDNRDYVFKEMNWMVSKKM